MRKRKKREEKEERKDREKGKGEREKIEGGGEEKWGRRASETISIITVDWLGLRATSCLLVFPFYVTTNLLLISYY